jgi:hypothetical protein
MMAINTALLLQVPCSSQIPSGFTKARAWDPFLEHPSIKRKQAQDFCLLFLFLLQTKSKVVSFIYGLRLLSGEIATVIFRSLVFSGQAFCLGAQAEHCPLSKVKVFIMTRIFCHDSNRWSS